MNHSHHGNFLMEIKQMSSSCADKIFFENNNFIQIQSCLKKSQISRGISYPDCCLCLPLVRYETECTRAEMSGMWSFSVRVQSWSQKIEPDHVLIRNFLKSSVRSRTDPPIWNHIIYYAVSILPHREKAVLELFFLKENMIIWSQNTPSSAYAS